MTDVPYIPYQFDGSKPHDSVFYLGSALFVDWRPDCEDVNVTQLTQGTTNQSFKAVRRTKHASSLSNEEDIALIKVYGAGTEATIDRQKELQFHALFAHHNLASPLLARFKNGHAYGFVPGHACSAQDVGREKVWRGVARELARWHVKLPRKRVDGVVRKGEEGSEGLPKALLDAGPNVWVTARKWLDAIPRDSAEQRALKGKLEEGFAYLVDTLLEGSAEEVVELVLGHGDLVCGNIIIEPASGNGEPGDEVDGVKFIDYEHCTYCPVAFELSNVFAEMAGFECDYNLLPTRSTRRQFIREYVRTCTLLVKDSDTKETSPSTNKAEDEETTVSELFSKVDIWRGFPGFYWGLCALIQEASAPEGAPFDYSGYANLRFAEFWAWRAETDGTRLETGGEVPMREERWGREVEGQKA